jgi:hypothetical protein
VYTSKTLFAEMYHGETIDMTAPIELVGNAVLSDVSTTLVPQVGELIKEQERLAPIDIFVTPKGETVIDFGQNMTGYVEVKIKAKRGDRIVIHHAEVLDKDGNFYNANYRSARNEMTYVCSGEDDVFKPSYSFQGFRYIKLSVAYMLQYIVGLSFYEADNFTLQLFILAYIVKIQHSEKHVFSAPQVPALEFSASFIRGNSSVSLGYRQHIKNGSLK